MSSMSLVHNSDQFGVLPVDGTSHWNEFASRRCQCQSRSKHVDMRYANKPSLILHVVHAIRSRHDDAHGSRWPKHAQCINLSTNAHGRHDFLIVLLRMGCISAHAIGHPIHVYHADWSTQ